MSLYHITSSDVAVVVLAAKTNDIKDYLAMVPEILRTLETIQRGQVVWVYADSP